MSFGIDVPDSRLMSEVRFVDNTAWKLLRLTSNLKISFY